MKAIVTGHSRGLGRALATQLSDAGWQVLGISRSAGTGLDLANPEALEAWLDGGELAAFLHGAEEILLINNAGTVSPSSPVGLQGAAAIVNAVQLNVTAALVLTDAVLRIRPKDTPVRIVHISSGAGRHPYQGWSVYCATKAALDMHAKALATENHPLTRVTAIAPGIVDTQMQADIRSSAAFPLRERFVDYKEQGSLVSADEAARQIIARIEAPDFGEETVSDIRS